jgi:hypothetical protein
MILFTAIIEIEDLIGSSASAIIESNSSTVSLASQINF